MTCVAENTDFIENNGFEIPCLFISFSSKIPHFSAWCTLKLTSQMLGARYGPQGIPTLRKRMYHKIVTLCLFSCEIYHKKKNRKNSNDSYSILLENKIRIITKANPKTPWNNTQCPPPCFITEDKKILDLLNTLIWMFSVSFFFLRS